MAKTLSYSGLQDVACKRYKGSRRLDAWAGVVVLMDKGVVMKSFLKHSWSKTKQKVCCIGEYRVMVNEYNSMDDEGATAERANFPADKIPFKKLERIMGFLV